MLLLKDSTPFQNAAALNLFAQPTSTRHDLYEGFMLCPIFWQIPFICVENSLRVASSLAQRQALCLRMGPGAGVTIFEYSGVPEHLEIRNRRARGNQPPFADLRPGVSVSRLEGSKRTAKGTLARVPWEEETAFCLVRAQSGASWRVGFHR